MFVYLITNTINGRRYVGQTSKTLAWRWWKHCYEDGCPYLHRAINKYGEENFTIELICEVPTQELADEFEAEYVLRYCTLAPNGYNLKTGGNKPILSLETRKKMSQSQKGRRPPTSFAENWTPEMKESAKQRSLGARNPNAKLTDLQAQEIRELYSTGQFSQADLGRKFLVGQTQISRIVLRRTSHG